LTKKFPFLKMPSYQTMPMGCWARAVAHSRDPLADTAMRQLPNFGRKPPFLLSGLSYMRDLLPEPAHTPEKRIGGVDDGGG
jgi:hypothetical protein